MLILVGVSITLAVNGGLFEYAGKAVGETKNAINQEGGLIDEIIDNYIVPNVPIEEKFSEIYGENTTITQGDYIATIPAGFAVGISDGINKIKNGLVITDEVDENGNSTGNEFVWVPCTTDANNTSVTKYAQDKKYNDGTVAEKENDYKDYSDWTDVGGNAASVGQYGGFYVARYEAGIPSNAPFYSNADGAAYTYDGRNTADYVPVSKKNNPSWNGINQTNAKTVSANMYKDSSSVESSLIDSYAWDTIVNWMESKIPGIATDSTNYGNYVNSTISLTDTLYAEHSFQYTPTRGWKNKANAYKKGELSITPRNQSGKQTVYEIATGSTNSTKVLNIYDMVGNLWEWTTETGYHNAGTGNIQYTVLRGGRF